MAFYPSDEEIEKFHLETRNKFFHEHPGHVYLLGSSLGYYKIGYTTNLYKRFTNFGVKLPFEVWLEDSKVYFDCSWGEKYWHKTFAVERVNGEWFKLNEDDIDRFHYALDDQSTDCKLNSLYLNDNWLPWDTKIMGEIFKKYNWFLPYKKAAISDYLDTYENSPGVNHQYIARKQAKSNPPQLDLEDDEFSKPLDPPEAEG